ncbi:type VI secretion system contractile sheath small subunit [Klebsiella aerogenes]|uniref:type VI secretion system contractile sheath small subunit n=1 Tax=Klebsiella aerogenes TaxID=548 RepID=UPI001F3DEE54|nr:type VI secretion system contractile sheath small subunit [Klebsiella aerogenes]
MPVFFPDGELKALSSISHDMNTNAAKRSFILSVIADKASGLLTERRRPGLNENDFNSALYIPAHPDDLTMMNTLANDDSAENIHLNVQRTNGFEPDVVTMQVQQLKEMLTARYLLYSLDISNERYKASFDEFPAFTRKIAVPAKSRFTTLYPNWMVCCRDGLCV